MTRAEYGRLLKNMEFLREAADEAESIKEHRELVREYSVISQAVRPYIIGEAKFTDERGD